MPNLTEFIHGHHTPDATVAMKPCVCQVCVVPGGGGLATAEAWTLSAVFSLRVMCGCAFRECFMDALTFTISSSVRTPLLAGADLSEYFNYGFNEQTWRLYSAKQRTVCSAPPQFLLLFSIVVV